MKIEVSIDIGGINSYNNLMYMLPKQGSGGLKNVANRLFKKSFLREVAKALWKLHKNLFLKPGNELIEM